MAMRASKQAHITLDDCRIPEENLIDVEGAGFYMLAEFFNHGRVIVGGQGIGLAAAASEEASEFVHDREAVGRSVDEFQAIQHHLANMRLEVANNDDAGYRAALAKTKATETATECAETGIKLHGGRSVLTERRIARVFRDSRIPIIYEGPTTFSGTSSTARHRGRPLARASSLRKKRSHVGNNLPIMG